MNYVSRLCYNTNGWARPAGSARGMEQGTFYSQYGYGHEEWLFRTEWQIGGWQYGFLQGINNSHNRFQGLEQLCNVTLYTLEPGRRRYVVRIRDLECISKRQSEDVLSVFKANGWLNTMLSEVQAVGGDTTVLGAADWVDGIVNVRFRIANVDWFEPATYSLPGDRISRLKRYQMIGNDASVPQPPEPRRLGRKGQDHPASPATFMRSGTPSRECTPEHARMQAILFEQLKYEYPNDKVVCEEDFIDVLVETPTQRILHEIKSDLCARTVIRAAIGQLLEYGYHSAHNQVFLIRLVIVGRVALQPADRAYLEYLTVRFSLSLEYRVVSI